MPFYRVHSSGTIPGTGLGLNIVQRYVRLMNGELHFESVPGQKTSFEMVFQPHLINHHLAGLLHPVTPLREIDDDHVNE